mgnify:FL=1
MPLHFRGKQHMFYRKRIAAAVSAAVAATATIGAAPLSAQEQALEETIVTGTRIQRANLVSSSPVTQLDSEQLVLTGQVRIEDALASIPAISLDQSSGQAIQSSVIATL